MADQKDTARYSCRARFNSSFASTSRWLVGSSKSRTLVDLLINLQSLTFACSPPLNTRTRLSICLVVSPHFARAERTSYWLKDGNSSQISSIQVFLFSPLISCSKYPISRFSPSSTEPPSDGSILKYSLTVSSYRFHWRRQVRFYVHAPWRYLTVLTAVRHIQSQGLSSRKYNVPVFFRV